MTHLVSIAGGAAWGVLCASQGIRIGNSIPHAAILIIPAILIGIAVPLVAWEFF